MGFKPPTFQAQGTEPTTKPPRCPTMFCFFLVQVDIFTFLTNDQSDSTDTGESLAGRLACQNNGVMSRIVDERDYFNQMKPFFDYIERHDMLQDNDNQFLSSYYSSPGDQSAVISVTQPVETSDGWGRNTSVGLLWASQERRISIEHVAIPLKRMMHIA